MKYIKKTFVNLGSPPINAAHLNGIENTLESLCAAAPNNATVDGGSTSANYNITVSNYNSSNAPTSSDYPILITFIPTVTNAAGCKITPSWTSTQYPIYDKSTNAAIGAEEMIAGIPVTLSFNGTSFYYDGGGKYLKFGSTVNTDGYWHKGDTAPTGNSQLAYSGYLIATKVKQGVWNDYAEYRECHNIVEPGRVVVETGLDSVVLSDKRLQSGAMIVSDTFGNVMGDCSGNNVPVAVAGRVLAYCDKDNLHVGDAVCSGKHGTVSKMSRLETILFPERILGVVSAHPMYEHWGTGNVEVNGRIWISVR